jgi:hypothetical protein
VHKVYTRKKNYLQATKGRDKINYNNKMKKQEEIECSDIFGFRMSNHQYKINGSKIQISKVTNAKPEKNCKCVNDVLRSFQC